MMVDVAAIRERLTDAEFAYTHGVLSAGERDAAWETLMAHAPQDLSDLLDALEASQAECERLRGRLEGLGDLGISQDVDDQGNLVDLGARGGVPAGVVADGLVLTPSAVRAEVVEAPGEYGLDEREAELIVGLDDLSIWLAVATVSEERAPSDREWERFDSLRREVIGRLRRFVG